MAGLLEAEFVRQLGRRPSPQEVMSWTNSLLRMTITIEEAKLLDHGIFLEYKLPSYGNRIDCIICGKDDRGVGNAVIIELKQWSRVDLSDYDSDKVLTYVAGGNREVLHPSVQVGGYKMYLEDNHTAFYEGPSPVSLSACSYLHNYKYDVSDPLFNSRFDSYLREYPVFTLDDEPELSAYLMNRLSGGEGRDVLSRIEQGRHRPSKKLMDHVGTVVKKRLQEKTGLFGRGPGGYILLDDQIIAYDAVYSLVKNGFHNRSKFSVIIKGGPGTGKSVIALQLLADLNAAGLNAQYATGSNSFTETLRKLVGTKAKGHFKYFMSYGDAQPNEVDVLIMDESHRIRERTGYPFKSTGRLQVEDLIRASKVSVFLVDELQIVRPNEIGSVSFIRTNAEKLGCRVMEIELTSQFRCSGSDAFINWINHTLHISNTANPEWVDDPNFEFTIFSSPDEMERAIRTKVLQGATGRVTAGFCWKWSDQPTPDGGLEYDIKIGDYLRQWNARNDAMRLRKGIPKASFWAYEPEGINQVGCIYTAQGFEFDYVGVIFGNDLRFDFERNEWVGHPENSHDSAIKSNKSKFVDLVKSTYRVLLTRGQKGCYVCFLDKDTENYFRTRIRRIS